MKYKLIEGEKIPIIEYETTTEFVNGFNDYEDYMYNKLYSCIKEIIDNNLEQDFILLALLGESEFMFGSPRDIWVDNLEGGLKHFLDTEQYEKCADVTVLINKLKNEECLDK
tara:strand:- start:22 stop:357 length:336 start_codon:yes stop_codon:yes gene_type:complete